MNPTSSGIIERLIYAGVLAICMRMVQRGYIDSDMATYIAAGAVAAFGSAWAWWQNRPKALLVAAAASAPEGTVIVTSNELAKDTPDSANILSKDDVKVMVK